MSAYTVSRGAFGLIIFNSCMQGNQGFAQLLFDLTVDFKQDQQDVCHEQKISLSTIPFG